MNKIIDILNKAKVYVGYLNDVIDVIIALLGKVGISTLSIDEELQAKIDKLAV